MLLSLNQLTLGDPSASGNALALPTEGLVQKLLGTYSATQAIDSFNVGDARAIQPGRCYIFDGTDDYVSLDSHATTLGASGAHSVSFWFQGSSDTAQTAWYVGELASGTERTVISVGDGISGTLTNELITVWRLSGGGVDYVVGYTTATRTELFDGNPHHITVTFGSDIKIYLDGASKTVTVGTGVNDGTYGGHSSLTGARIGCQVSSGTASGFLNGKTYSYYVYDDELTANEITYLYTHGVSGTDPATTNLLGLYKMDEPFGSVMYDSSGNGYDGVPTNITASTFFGTDTNVTYSWQNSVGYSLHTPIVPVLDSGEWSLQGGGASIDSSTTYSTTSGGEGIRLATNWSYDLTIGAEYTLTANISGASFDGIYNNSAGVGDKILTGAGTQTVTFTATDNHLYLRNGSAGTTTVTSITIVSTDMLIPRDESNITQDVLGGSLTYSGKVPYNADLVGSHCGTFDGVNDYATVPNTDDLNFGTGDFTITFRANITSSAGWEVIMGKSDNVDASNFRIFKPSGTTNLQLFYGSDSQSYVKSTGSFTAGAFQDFAVGVDSTGTLFYHVGGTYSEHSITVQNLNNTQPFILGGDAYNAGYYADMKICDVRFFKGSRLTQSQIEEVFAGTFTTEPTVHLPMAEGDGDTLYNSAGSGNHAKLMNITTANFWANTQDVYHRNILNGFTVGVNALGYSEDFTSWTKVNSSITSDAVSGPLTGSNADKLYENTASATQHRLDQTSAIGTGTATFHCYAKAGERDKVKLRIGTAPGSGGIFDLTNGTVSTPSTGSATITDAGSGWYRCSVTQTAAGSDVCRINLVDASDQLDYTGDGSSGLYIFGAQIEAGSSASDYQRTITASDNVDVKLPSTSSDTDVWGNTPSNTAGAWHNNAETDLKMGVVAPALTTGTFWYSSGTPQTRTYTDITTDYNSEQITFADVSVTNKKKNLVTYSSAQSGSALTRIQKYLNH